MLRSTRTLLTVICAAVAITGCSGKKAPAAELAPARLTTIGINSYLWRATIDTLSFAPLTQVDSNGGVVVTDWYVNPKAPGERVKITAAILDAELRADALRIAAVRQVAQNGVWVDAPVSAATVQSLEDIVLTRARDLRRGTLAR